MTKLIIDNRTDKTTDEILSYVATVINGGRVSNYGKQYCYATVFKDGIVVYSDLNKKSDKLTVLYDVTRDERMPQ
jgi:hypothetical protein